MRPLGGGPLHALDWWLATFRANASAGLWSSWYPARVPIVARMYSDASGDVGFAGIFDGRVVQGRWDRKWQASPLIRAKELVPVVYAVRHYAAKPEARGKVLIVTTDNLSNVYAINRGSCRDRTERQLLQEIYDTAASNSMFVLADWIPREYNQLAVSCPSISTRPRSFTAPEGSKLRSP